jgi:Domain of unknown function (DUF5658)
MARAACVLVFVCSLAAPRAAAQDLSLVPVGLPSIDQVQVAAPAQSFTQPTLKRPSVLVPMYVSFAALQGFDYASTTRAISSGAGREANPVMGPIVGNRAAFLAVKAGGAAGTMWIAERMWKKHPAGAIVFMAALNGVMATVVTHNMRVVR